MNNLTVELNGKKYVRTEFLASNSEEITALKTQMIRFGGIFQGIKKLKIAGLFTSGSVIYSLLVAEEKIFEWNKFVIDNQ